jgi:hypothetical protein
MLLTPAGRIDQLVKGRGLLAGQPDKEWNSILGHLREDSSLLSADSKAAFAITEARPSDDRVLLSPSRELFAMVP